MDWHRSFLLCLISVSCILATPVKEDDKKCGYESCPVPQKDVLNVHIVPHTHDDVGWLKTVDQYYYGSRNDIQKAGVQYILDTVVQELFEDSNRRFIYVETAFFWQWWTKQGDLIRHKVKRLVDEGRLEFIGGAWSMNDEATTHYQSIVDQFTWGLRKLNDTFGECGRPRVAWQIDPFGHSREMANLLAAMGYDGLFHGRIDYQDKRHRFNTKTNEMMWRGSDDIGSKSDLFTGILYNTYSPPPGFCFDVLCSDEPIIDDPASPMFNVDEKIDDFVQYVKTQSTVYKSNNVIVTMGGDFTYMDANMWFVNLDKLIKYVNRKSKQDNLGVNLFYSTPSCYLKAVYDSGITLDKKYDDFFPYASDQHSYWTGYFTSRPTLKYFERQGNNYLQMCKQLYAFTNLEERNLVDLNALRTAMGIMQHHDAVTGTEKQHVAFDYARILNQGIEDCLDITREAFGKLMHLDKDHVMEFSSCQFNISQCQTSETTDTFIVTVYNPFSHSVNYPVRIPIAGNDKYKVVNNRGIEYESDIIPINPNIKLVQARKSKAVNELVFIANDLLPLGYESFYISLQKDRKTRDLHEEPPFGADSYVTIMRDAKKDGKNVDNLYVGEYFNSNPNAYNNRDSYNVDGSYGNVGNRPLVEIYAEKNPFPSERVKLSTYKDDILDEIPADIMEDVEFASSMPLEEAEMILVKGDRRGSDKNTRGFRSLDAFDGDERMLGDQPTPTVINSYQNEDSVVYISNANIRVYLNPDTGLLTALELKDGTNIEFTQHFAYYKGFAGHNQKPKYRSSGAYIFRPTGAALNVLAKNITYNIIRGKNVEEIHQTFSDYISQVVRVYKDQNSYEVEFEWQVGPIPVEDEVGKEIVTLYTTNLESKESFYTDSNGRQMLKRTRDKRPTWELHSEEPISGNYYPITSKISIRDESENLQFSVLNDRAQGGTSLRDGQLEIMLHRRLLYDDAFGVGEPLNETENDIGLVARGKHYVTFGKAKTQEAYEKQLALKILLSPRVFLSNAYIDFNAWSQLVNKWSGTNKTLPENVHLMTLEPWKGSLLIRFEHFIQKNDTNGDLSKSVSFDLLEIFNGIEFSSLRETTLGANKWLDNDSDNEEFIWNRNNEFESNLKEKSNDIRKENRENGDFIIELDPMEIKTYIAKIKYLD